MKKFFLTLLMISVVVISSIAAQSMSVTLCAYVPEKVAFEETANGYTVNSTVTSASYGFYDNNGNQTDAYNASFFNVVAN